ncbi:MAG TPA: hypothetical protein DCP32_01430 [Anaerolineaceae bacterium]|nr:MAG: hypothetical protein A2X24_03830 [Chloroflexi bacterium GWB2_54_36]HAL15443.1 hypothetical protein [Anaerolineaceae bacterium]HBA91113.1 hypothetical protein [Anaerolineaceae bacterium]
MAARLAGNGGPIKNEELLPQGTVWEKRAKTESPKPLTTCLKFSKIEFPNCEVILPRADR